MTKDRTLTQSNFDALLVWLDPDRDLAAAKYEDIRAQLIRMFVYRGSLFAEELADETINRVAGKISELAGSYAGEPALYFCGVARNVYRESLKAAQAPPMPVRTADPPGVPEDPPAEYLCLEKCMESLPPESRKVILDYYEITAGEQIEGRKKLARALGIAPNALRIRAHRIRARLFACVSRCIEGKAGRRK